VRGEILADGVPVAAATGPSSAGDPVQWSVRPDRVHLREEGPYEGVVVDVADLGSTATLTVALANTDVELAVRSLDAGGLEPGDKCRLAIDPADVIVWPGIDPS
jgi:ABC-type Fe3+/spermidine/putrescine transport system ATPase subunit